MRGPAPQVRGRAEAVISVTSPTSAATVAAAAGGGSSQAQPNKNITSDTRLCRGLVPLLNTNSLSFVRLLLCPDPELDYNLLHLSRIISQRKSISSTMEQTGDKLM